MTLKHKDRLGDQLGGGGGGGGVSARNVRADVGSVEAWVQDWLVNVNSTKRHRPLPPPPGTVRQLLDALEAIAPSFVEDPGAARKNEVEDLARRGLKAVKERMEGLEEEEVRAGRRIAAHYGA
jgi:hypothetical protein